MYRIDFSSILEAAEIIYCFMTIPSLTNQECSLFGESGIPETIVNDGIGFMSEQSFCKWITGTKFDAISCVASTDKEDTHRVVLALMPGADYLVLSFPNSHGEPNATEARLLHVLRKVEDERPQKPKYKERVRSMISRDMLWNLYVEEKKTDAEIAALYGVNAPSVKRLRTIYDISSSDRTPLPERLPIELFHRMYVVSRIGLGQIAELFDSSRTTITALKRQYSSSDHPLAKEIASTTNCGYYPRHLSELMEIMDRSELIEELKTKTVFEIASWQGLIPLSANQHPPMTKEWLEAELLNKSEATIAEEHHITPARLSIIVNELGAKKPNRLDRLTEELLRELYLTCCWSDETIAKHIGVSYASVKRQRQKYGISFDMRPSEYERIPPELFRYLYIEEGMSLVQIGEAFHISDAKIRAMKQKYIEDGYTDLQRRGPKVTPERLQYLNKLIHLNQLKV